MNVPLALLNQVPAARTEWLVPGLLKEKVKALAKSMPQRLRHKLGALDDFAAAFSAAVPPTDLPLAEALRRYVRERVQPGRAGGRVPPGLGAAAPAHELPRARRGRPAARAWAGT